MELIVRAATRAKTLSRRSLVFIIRSLRLERGRAALFIRLGDRVYDYASRLAESMTKRYFTSPLSMRA